MAYDAERADARALDELEAVLRHVADELAGWRARALKAESDTRGRGGPAGAGAAAVSPPPGLVGADAGLRDRIADLEQENRVLRQRLEGARARLGEVVQRLSFLEEQSRAEAAAR